MQTNKHAHTVLVQTRKVSFLPLSLIYLKKDDPSFLWSCCSDSDKCSACLNVICTVDSCSYSSKQIICSCNLTTWWHKFYRQEWNFSVTKFWFSILWTWWWSMFEASEKPYPYTCIQLFSVLICKNSLLHENLFNNN